MKKILLLLFSFILLFVNITVSSEGSVFLKMKEEKILQIISEFPSKDFRKKLCKFINTRKGELLRKSLAQQLVYSEAYWPEKYVFEFGENSFEKEVLTDSLAILTLFESFLIESLSKDRLEIFPKIDKSELVDVDLN